MDGRADRSKRKRKQWEKIYTCCQCGFGPMLDKNYPACIHCHEPFCSLCTIETVSSSSEQNTLSTYLEQTSSSRPHVKPAADHEADNATVKQKTLAAIFDRSKAPGSSNADQEPQSCLKTGLAPQEQGNDDRPGSRDLRGTSEASPVLAKPKKRAARQKGPCLACPYFRHDPQKYPCWRGGWPETRYLQQDHLTKYHRKQYKCIDCDEIFKTKNEAEHHGYNSISCLAGNFESNGEMDERQEEQIKKVQKAVPKATELQKWGRFVEILIPDHHPRIFDKPYRQFPTAGQTENNTQNKLSYWDAYDAVVNFDLVGRLRRALAHDSDYNVIPDMEVQRALLTCESLYHSLTQLLQSLPTSSSDQRHAVRVPEDDHDPNFGFNIEQSSSFAAQNPSAPSEIQSSILSNILSMPYVVDEGPFTFPTFDANMALCLPHGDPTLEEETFERKPLSQGQTWDPVPFDFEQLPTYGTGLQADFSDIRSTLIGGSMSSKHMQFYPPF